VAGALPSTLPRVLASIEAVARVRGTAIARVRLDRQIRARRQEAAQQRR